MEFKEAKIIVDDVLAELNGLESNKPIGKGVTSEDYVKEKLQDVYVDYFCNEQQKEEQEAHETQHNEEESFCDECGKPEHACLCLNGTQQQESKLLLFAPFFRGFIFKCRRT